MLTYQDCLPLIALDDEEARVLADCPTVPEEVVLDLARYLLLTDEGLPALRRNVLDDLATCRRSHNSRRSAELKTMMRSFVEHHPLRA